METTQPSKENNSKPDLESIINEVSASEDFQNLLKSVSKNIGSIVQNSKNNAEFRNLINPPNPPPTDSVKKDEEVLESNVSNSKENGSSDIRTVPLESSVHTDDDSDNVQDTILTLFSDSEGNTIGEIASSIDQNLKVIAEQLTCISKHYQISDSQSK